MDISQMLLAVGMPVLRSVGGWLNHAMKDGVVDRFEWKLLGETCLRTALIGVFVYVGAEGWGVDLDLAATAGTAVVVDLVVSALKKR